MRRGKRGEGWDLICILKAVVVTYYGLHGWMDGGKSQSADGG